jgi:hypothetical protein
MQQQRLRRTFPGIALTSGNVVPGVLAGRVSGAARRRPAAEKLDEAGRGAEANQWLSDSAQVGNLNALHVLAGRLEQADPNQGS